MTDYSKQIEEYIAEEARVMAELDCGEISRAMNAIVGACGRGATVWTLGNGGSAATASHFVCDFAKGCYEGAGLPLRMVCLSDNVPMMTAISNDISYEDCFAFQLRDRVREGDLLIAISGSGNSENVIRAVEYAKSRGAEVIGLTGYSGGRLMGLSDYRLHVPADNMQIAEDLHMMFDHAMMYVLCEGKTHVSPEGAEA